MRTDTALRLLALELATKAHQEAIRARAGGSVDAYVPPVLRRTTPVESVVVMVTVLT